MITKLKKNTVIVVGTNLLGEHHGGAAAQAHRDFRLEWGVGEGLSGQTYAFPTLGRKMQKRNRLNLISSIGKLYRCAFDNPKLTFLMTPVGTGIAQYSHKYMKSLFIMSQIPDNVVLPKEWI